MGRHRAVPRARSATPRRPDRQPRGGPRAARARPHAWCGTQQQPGWAQPCPARALRSAMINHVTQVATHYKGKIYAWDVVNEAFADGGSGAPRSTRTCRRTGNDWIEAAFRTARAADPARQALLQRLQHRRRNAEDTGRLQHGARLQGPRRADRLRRLPVPPRHRRPAVDYQANLQRFADLGVDVQITELDIAQAPTRPTSTPHVSRPAWTCRAAPASPCGASGTATPGAPGRTRCCSTATATRRPPTTRR